MKEKETTIGPAPLRDARTLGAPRMLVLAGAASDAVRAHAAQNSLRLIDYLTREELAIRNAVPAALAI